MNAAEKLIVNTLHARFEDYPFVNLAPGIEIKLVHARLSQNLTVIQMRVQPFAKTGLHRHLAPQYGLTTMGAWGHDPHEFLYRPNSYICEPVGEIHRFHNGPDVSEAYFIRTGETESFDDKGQLTGRQNAEGFLKIYLERCEAAGLRRPSILS